MDGRDDRAPRSHLVGLDLGQAKDYSALIVAERKPLPTGRYVPTEQTRIVQGAGGTVTVEPVMRELIHHRYDIRHIQRFPLGTPYPAVVAGTKHLIELLPPEPKPRLAIDYTGVGRPVLDMFVAAKIGIPITPVTIITSAGKARRDPDRPSEWHVPKKDLIGVVQVLAQNGRLKIGTFPETPMLVEELEKFKMKFTLAATVTYEAWREGDHDDLVLALAIACWTGERVAGGGLH